MPPYLRHYIIEIHASKKAMILRVVNVLIDFHMQKTSYLVSPESSEEMFYILLTMDW